MRPSVRGRNRLWLAVGLAMVVAAALPEAHAQRAKRAARPPAASTSKRPAKGAKARPAKGARARPAKAAATEAAASKAAPTRGQANAARERFNRGAALYQQGSFGPALAEFQAAYDLRPHYSVLYNIAQCYVWLHRPVDATNMLGRYLREGAAGVRRNRRVEVDRMLADLARQIGRVTLAVNVDGAELTLDGSPIGSAPLTEPLVVPAGPHTLAVRATGHRPATREVAVVGGEEQRIELRLEPLPAQVTIETEGGEAARVTIDEQPAQPAPWSGELAGGRHRAVVRARGRRDVTREFEVTAGGSLRLTIGLGERIGRLRIQPDVPGAVVLVDNQPPPADGVILTGVHQVRVEAPPRWAYEGTVRVDAARDTEVRVHLGSGSRQPSAVLLGSALGLAALGAVATGVFGGLALSSQGSYESLAQRFRSSTDPGEQSSLSGQATTVRQEGERWALLSDVGLGVAVIAAAAAALYYLLSPTERSSSTEAQRDVSDVAFGFGTLTAQVP